MATGPTAERIAPLSDVQAPVWPIIAEPALEIGAADADSVYELHRVRGVARMSDGRIVVLDAGSSEIRIFDARGRFLQKAGRQGSGPGELRRPWAMYLRSDTIIIIDPGTSRLSLHAPDGQFIATRPYDKSIDTGDSWLYDNSVIVGGAVSPLYERIREAIPRLPRPDTAIFFRQVRAGAENELWVRSQRSTDTTSIEWIIFDYAGNALGRATVPREFTMYEIGADQLLGVWQDSLGVESVRVLTVERSSRHPAAGAAANSGTASRSTSAPAVHEKLRTVLQALALYQEHYYARPNHDYVFATSITELRSFDAPPEVKQTSLDAPPGVVVRILSAGRLGWFALAADTASGAICGTGEGFVLPQTWSSNPLVCF